MQGSPGLAATQASLHPCFPWPRRVHVCEHRSTLYGVHLDVTRNYLRICGAVVLQSRARPEPPGLCYQSTFLWRLDIHTLPFSALRGSSRDRLPSLSEDHPRRRESSMSFSRLFCSGANGRQGKYFVDDAHHARIADFGLAIVGDGTVGRMTTVKDAGTMQCMPPERLDPSTEGLRQTAAGDVYAFGCLCYVVSTSTLSNRTA